jgi:hypothetical protein
MKDLLRKSKREILETLLQRIEQLEEEVRELRGEREQIVPEVPCEFRHDLTGLPHWWQHPINRIEGHAEHRATS